MAKVIRSIFIPDAQGFIPRKATRQHHHHHSRERCVRMWAAWGVERLATAWVRTQARQEGRTGVSALAGTAAPSQTEAEGRIRPLHSLQLRVIRVTDDADHILLLSGMRQNFSLCFGHARILAGCVIL